MMKRSGILILALLFLASLVSAQPMKTNMTYDVSSNWANVNMDQIEVFTPSSTELYAFVVDEQTGNDRVLVLKFEDTDSDGTYEINQTYLDDYEINPSFDVTDISVHVDPDDISSWELYLSNGLGVYKSRFGPSDNASWQSPVHVSSQGGAALDWCFSQSSGDDYVTVGVYNDPYYSDEARAKFFDESGWSIPLSGDDFDANGSDDDLTMVDVACWSTPNYEDSGTMFFLTEEGDLTTYYADYWNIAQVGEQLPAGTYGTMDVSLLSEVFGGGYCYRKFSVFVKPSGSNIYNYTYEYRYNYSTHTTLLNNISYVETISSVSGAAFANFDNSPFVAGVEPGEGFTILQIDNSSNDTFVRDYKTFNAPYVDVAVVDPGVPGLDQGFDDFMFMITDTRFAIVELGDAVSEPAVPIIRGTITTDGSGDPIEDAEVTYTLSGTDYTAYTDADGEYALALPSANTYQLSVSAANHTGFVDNSETRDGHYYNLDYSLPRSIPNGQEGEPGELAIGVSPNPFNPATTVRLTLPAPEKVSVKVYNMTGALVATLNDSRLSGGTHDLVFDGSALASGVYVLQVNGERTTHHQKLLLMK